MASMERLRLLGTTALFGSLFQLAHVGITSGLLKRHPKCAAASSALPIYSQLQRASRHSSRRSTKPAEHLGDDTPTPPTAREEKMGQCSLRKPAQLQHSCKGGVGEESQLVWGKASTTKTLPEVHFAATPTSLLPCPCRCRSRECRAKALTRLD